MQGRYDMEGIRSLSQSLFARDQKFLDPPASYKFDAVELNSFPDAPNDCKQARAVSLAVGERDLCAWLPSLTRDTAGRRTPEATLRLVRISRNLDVSLCISRSGFDIIFDSMKADPSVKYMICRDYDGFHEFYADGFRLTRFLGTALYALVWTFDPATLTTTAMFLDRRRQLFAKFVDVLQEYSNLISTPSLLCFVSCYFLLQIFDQDTGGWELATVRSIEEQTGFGPHPAGYRGVEPLSLAKKFHINQLTSWLQAVNEVAGNVEKRARHQRISLALLKTIREEHESGEQYGVSGQALSRCQGSLKALRDAVPCVERLILTYTEYLAYLQDRSSRLSSVVRATVRT